MAASLGSKMLAESVGTFALTFIGVMAIHATAKFDPNASLVAVALAHGLALAVAITAAAPTSGGHINPAVTFGFLITGMIKLGDAIAYVIAQLAGAVVACLAVCAIYGFDKGGYGVVAGGTPQVGADFSTGAALLAEIIATFFLMYAVWGTAVDPRAPKIGGFGIGLTVAFDILAVGGISGASMNPARSFGPQLVGSLASAGAPLWSTHWLYWIGPCAGAGIAALLYKTLMMPKETPKV